MIAGAQACLAFVALFDGGACAAWLGILLLELVREQYGMHQCDRRRNTLLIGAQFGSRVCGLEKLPPSDELWYITRTHSACRLLNAAFASHAYMSHYMYCHCRTDQREAKASVAERCDTFLRWLRDRPETDVALVAHHHVLLVLFHVSLNCSTHPRSI